MASVDGKGVFSAVSAFLREFLSKFCKADIFSASLFSCAIASDDGKGFFSAVSAFLSDNLSNSATAETSSLAASSFPAIISTQYKSTRISPLNVTQVHDD